MKRVTKIVTILLIIALFLLTASYDKQCIEEDKQAQEDCRKASYDEEETILFPFELGE